MTHWPGGRAAAAHAAYVRALIAHRAPELTEADLALLVGEPDGTLPVEMVEVIVDAIDALDDKLDRLADALAHAGE